MEALNETKKDVGALKTMVDGIIDGVNEVSNDTAQIVNSVVSVSENTNRVFELSGNGVDGAEMIYAYHSGIFRYDWQIAC